MAAVVAYPEKQESHRSGSQYSDEHVDNEAVKGVDVQFLRQKIAVKVFVEFEVIKVSDQNGKEENREALKNEENAGHGIQAVHAFCLFRGN